MVQWRGMRPYDQGEGRGAQAFPFRRYLSWVKKGSFAVLDQGLFAGANFLVNILLARWLSPAQYGAFSVAYSIFLLLATFHTAVLIEPMLVFGPGRYGAQFGRYLRFLFYSHWGLTGGASLILALAAGVFWQLGSVLLAQSLLGLAVAAPFIQLTWLLRRAFYVPLEPHWAATGGGLHLVLMMAGMYGLGRQHLLSSFSALLVMGASSVVVSLWLSSMLKPQREMREGSLTLGTVVADHWGYGKWSSITAALRWVPLNINYLLLPIWFGLEGSASFRAIMNFVMPVQQSFAAISMLLVPLYVKALQHPDRQELSRSIRVMLALFGIGSALYWALLALFRYPLMNWFYGGRYLEHSNLLVLAGLTALPTGVGTVFGSVLRAMERPDQVFWSFAISGAAFVVVGLPLLPLGGLMGGLLGLLASLIAAGVASVWFYRRSSRKAGPGSWMTF